MIDREQVDVRPSPIKVSEIGTMIATSLQNKVRAISLSKFPVLSLLHLVFTIVGWLIVIGSPFVGPLFVLGSSR